MTNINEDLNRVQTEEGVVIERYPYEDLPRTVHDRGWYETGFIDGFLFGLVVCGLLVIFGFVLSVWK